MAAELTRRKVSIAAFLILTLIVTIMMALMLKNYLIAMTMGLIMAILVGPVHRFFLAKKLRPNTSALIVTLLLTFVIIAPAMTFAAMAAKQGITFGKWASEQELLSLDSTITWINTKLPSSLQIEINAELHEEFKTMITTVGKGATSVVLSIAKEIPEAIMQIFIILLTCFFVLADGKQLIKWITEKLPMANELRATLSGSFQDTAISVVWATMAAAATQAAMMFLGFLALGIPAAFLAGGSTFIFAFIPVVGATPVWIAGSIYLYTQGAVTKVVILVVIGILTGLADNIIRPLVLKGRGEMHPFISFIAIFGGMQMFGFFGVFLGPIVAAVLLSLIQIFPKIIDQSAGPANLPKDDKKA